MDSCKGDTLEVFEMGDYKPILLIYMLLENVCFQAISSENL